MLYLQLSQPSFSYELGFGVLLFTAVVFFAMLAIAVPLTRRPPGRTRTLAIVHIVAFALLVALGNMGSLPPYPWV